MWTRTSFIAFDPTISRKGFVLQGYQDVGFSFATKSLNELWCPSKERIYKWANIVLLHQQAALRIRLYESQVVEKFLWSWLEDIPQGEPSTFLGRRGWCRGVFLLFYPQNCQPYLFPNRLYPLSFQGIPRGIDHVEDVHGLGAPGGHLCSGHWQPILSEYPCHVR